MQLHLIYKVFWHYRRVVSHVQHKHHKSINLEEKVFSAAINFDVITKGFYIKIILFQIFHIPQNRIIFYMLHIQKHAYCSVQRHYSLVFPLF